MSGKQVMKFAKKLFGEHTREYTEISVFVKDKESKGYFDFMPRFNRNKRRLKFRLTCLDAPLFSRKRVLRLVHKFRR